MTPRQARTVVILVEIAGILVLLLGMGLLETVGPAVSITGLIIVVVGFVIELVFWRCPRCRRWLPTQNLTQVEVCPYCGAGIDDPKSRDETPGDTI